MFGDKSGKILVYYCEQIAKPVVNTFTNNYVDTAIVVMREII